MAKVVQKMDPNSLEVLYRDDRVMVINKPSGLLVHRGWGNDPVVATDLVQRISGSKQVHPIHRLDRGTSGPLLFGLDKETAAILGKQFSEREVEKRYWAFVRGITPEEGIIDHPLPRQKDGPRVPSVTHYTRLCTFERYSLVDAWPQTGRLHQVRRHLKHISHPLIGDAKYGKKEHTDLHKNRFGLDRMALHCWVLVFEHPTLHTPIECIANMPADLAEPFAKMQLEPASWERRIEARRANT